MPVLLGEAEAWALGAQHVAPLRVPVRLSARVLERELISGSVVY